MIKSLLRTFRRFKTSMIINVLGLTVAFVAFLIIMIQVSFEKNYESKTPDSERVFRVAAEIKNVKSMAIWPRPLIDECIASSSHVVEGTSIYPYERYSYCTVKRDDGSDVSFREDFARVDPGVVSILGLNIIAGDKNVLEHPDVYLISEQRAKKMFGTTDVVGKTINNKPIGAVYKDRPANSVVENFIFYNPVQKDNNRFSHNYIFLVKIDDLKNKDDVMKSFNRVIEAYYKGSWLDDGKMSMPVVSFTSIRDLYFTHDAEYDLPTKGNSKIVNIALSIALLIIVIAIINYINFASSLTPLRVKAINLQKILGANIVSQRLALLLESVAISMIAFLLALAAVQFLSYTSLSKHFDVDIAIMSNVGMVINMGIIAIAVGIIAGLYPASYMTSFPPILALKGSFGMSPKGRFYRSVLICFQFIISISLIIVTLFVNLQNRFVSSFDVGFNRDNILCINLPEHIAVKPEVVKSQIMAFGEFEDVAFSKERFGASDSYMFNSADFAGINSTYNCIVVSPNLFDLLGIEISEGRRFNEQDMKKKYGSLIFNQVAKNLDPINIKVGEMFGDYQNGWATTGEIIGITSPALHTLSLRQNEEPACFVIPKNEGDFLLANAYIKIKNGSNLNDAIAHLKKALKNIDPAYSPDIDLFDDAFNSLYQKEQRSGFIITAFSILAILISLMGVFGLVLFETQYRKKEIGVRRVFGSSVAGILQMINIKFIKIIFICFAISAPLSYWIVKQWLASYACKTPIYWWVFAAALLIVLFITILTVTIRSYKVATSNPAMMVKTE